MYVLVYTQFMDKANKKTERFEMRVSPQVKTMAQTKAKKKGLTVAAWIEKLIRRAR